MYIVDYAFFIMDVFPIFACFLCKLLEKIACWTEIFYIILFIFGKITGFFPPLMIIWC